MENNNVVAVNMWGNTIGYLHQQDNGTITLRYNKDFQESGIEVSPITMPLSNRLYTFPRLPEVTFHQLPGLVADSLPDKFGTAVINRYLESQGRTADSLSVIEKLCYTGTRGMGALEYEPAKDLHIGNYAVDLDALTQLASDVLSEKEDFHTRKNDALMTQLMESGSSVGGARAKTLIAWNPETNDIRSGQIQAGTGYEYWLLKFDNIKNNRDKDQTPDEAEYTRIEYAYYLMAAAAGIEMSECRLYEENGSAHFMTKRFDRRDRTGEKIHMQSLCALAHMDFNSPRIHSYEEAFNIMKRLRLPYDQLIQLFRRMVFNDFAKNFDDHTKNISFLMDKNGAWSLAPAYDVTFSYRQNSVWVNSHQMLINGKAKDIVADDFLKVAKLAGIKKSDALKSIEQVRDAVFQWKDYAEKAGVSEKNADRINRAIC